MLRTKDILKNVSGNIKNHMLRFSLLLSSMLSPIAVSSASGGADTQWQNFIDFIVPWITRLGGVVFLIGAVEFGLAFKNDDAEGKTKGVRTVIAGCIVIAVGLSSGTFLS